MGFLRFLTFCALFCALIGQANPVHGQTTPPWSLTESTPTENNLFGLNLSASDTRVAIATQSRFLNVFDRSGTGEWLLTRTLPSSGGSNAHFGGYLSLDGNVVATSGAGSTVGIYEKDVGGVDAWGLAASISQPSGSGIASFGNQVLLQGARLFVAANDGGSGGAVYVYEKNGGGTWSFIKEIRDPKYSSFTGFGGSISAEGDRLVVGSVFGDPSVVQYQNGVAYVFEKDANGIQNSWGLTATLTPLPPTSPTEFDLHFGEAVFTSGDEIIVGAPWEYDLNGIVVGSVYVFRLNSGVWELKARLTPFDGEHEEAFGYSISLKNNQLAIGSVRPVSEKSVVYIYERPTASSNAWALRNRYVGCNSPLRFAGTFISPPTATQYSNSHLFIGSPGTEVNGFNLAGIVEIIDKESTACSDFYGCEDDDIILPETFGINSTQVIATSESISTGGAFEIVAPMGDVTLSAGTQISLGNGFSVESGALFTAEINSGACS